MLDDHVDPWARSRALENLDQIRSSFPSDPTLSVGLGPDATGVGWVYQYALRSKTETLEKLRSLQDWYIRYALQSVSGVSEVASVGGSVREYQVQLDPNKLRAYDVSLVQAVNLVRESNLDQGGRWLESGGNEVLLRGLKYIHDTADLRKIVLKTDSKGVRIPLDVFLREPPRAIDPAFVLANTAFTAARDLSFAHQLRNAWRRYVQKLSDQGGVDQERAGRHCFGGREDPHHRLGWVEFEPILL